MTLDLPELLPPNNTVIGERRSLFRSCQHLKFRRVRYLIIATLLRGRLCLAVRIWREHG